MHNAILGLDRLDTAVRQLQGNPSVALDEMWANTHLGTARHVDTQGRKLGNDEGVPELAAEIHQAFADAGAAMEGAANVVFIAISSSRVPNGSDGTFADQAEDELDNAADRIEAVIELVQETCP